MKQRHLRVFSSTTEYDNYWSDNKPVPSNVFLNKQTDELIYNDYSKIPFTIEMLSAGTIYLKYDWDEENDWYYRDDLYYWINGDYDNRYGIDFCNSSIDVEAGDKVSFASDAEHPYSYYDPSIGSSLGINYIYVDSPFIVYGNLHSLNNWQTLLRPSWGADNPYGYYVNFLSDNENLISAKNLYMNVSAGSSGTYWFLGFFRNCSNLIEGPKTLGSYLSDECYASMFYGCGKLTKAPELPSTTLMPLCYRNMFSYCTSLTNAPVLPATTLAPNCYNWMFYHCSALTGVTSWAYSASTLGISTYSNQWLDGVSQTGVFKQNPDAIWNRGVNGIPSGWKVKNDINFPTNT